MVHALDPRIPRVWRTPHSIQFGIDEPVLVLDEVSSADERMLVALAAGVTTDGLQLVADRAGSPETAASAAAELLRRVTPVLAPERRDPLPPPALVVLDGCGPTAAALDAILHDAGMEVRSGLSWTDEAVDRADAAVIVASYAVEPQRHARWLRRDVPHLPIVFGDTGVTVGPYVRPGRGPCLRCLDLHRTDDDPAWPAMATQLHTRTPPGETAVVAAATAARVAAVLLAGWRDPGVSPRTGVSARLPAGGTDWVSREWAPHPECGCLGLPA
ncbi:hypothetical protein [Leifsonia sp. LS-T14]|uniref:hypothetical protein n=1 Tax=unclassified Leifsonia TaxID=2663824 RepID=UPI0035A6E05E